MVILQIDNLGNMGVMSCLGQGGLHPLSALALYVLVLLVCRFNVVELQFIFIQELILSKQLESQFIFIQKLILSKQLLVSAHLIIKEILQGHYFFHINSHLHGAEM